MAQKRSVTAKTKSVAEVKPSVHPVLVSIRNVSNSTLFLNIKETGMSIHLFPKCERAIEESLLESADVSKQINNNNIIIRKVQ